jgi:hypothetical protein
LLPLPSLFVSYQIKIKSKPLFICILFCIFTPLLPSLAPKDLASLAFAKLRAKVEKLRAKVAKPRAKVASLRAKVAFY